MISTIIFDMNGVITDDEHIHELATKQAFAKVGLDVTAEMYRKFCLGRTDVSAFKDLIAAYSLQGENREELIAGKTELYLQLIKDNLRVYPGVVSLINVLSKTFVLALTTSSTIAEAQTVIQLLNLEDKFKVVVTSEDVVYGKPHPEPYLLTAKKLGVSSKECLVIEDSENGVKSAKAAGMFCVAIPNTETTEKLTLADKIVQDYSELTDGFIQKIK